jgi:hypothetical protein
MNKQMAVTMIVNSKSNRIPVSSIAKECGMTVDQVGWIIQKMRKAGAIPHPKKYRIVAESPAGVMRFDGIQQAIEAGYSESCIKRCWNGEQKHHAGYSWQKEYLPCDQARNQN